MSRLKVAMATPFPHDPTKLSGGVDAVVAYLSEALVASQKIDLTLVTLDKSITETQQSDFNGAKAIRVPASRLPTRAGLFASARLLARALQALKPDIVHAQIAGVYALGAAKCETPRILTLHGIRHLEAQLWEGWLNKVYRAPLIALEERTAIRCSPYIVSISPFVTASFDLTRKTVFPIENPVAQAFFDVGEKAKQPGNTILFVGRLIKRKDPLTLVRALAKVRQHVPDAQLRIAGGGLSKYDQTAYTRELKAEVAALGLNDAVTFLGELGEREILAEYERADVLACVSVLETAPMVISQALAAGVPVVTTNSGGCEHMIDPGKNGFVADIGDDQVVADGLVRCLSPDDRPVFARHARDAAFRRFSPQIVAEQTLAAYESVLGQNRSRS